MRLIDADALIRTFCKQACQCTRSECKYTLEHDGRDACYDVLFVDAAPTITPENVRGEWEHGMKCTRCGQIDISKPNFCCNCGAGMRSIRNPINGEVIE